MTRVILWRHARTAYNRESRLQGSLDIALDDAGSAQAMRAAERMLAEYGRPDAIVSSPLARAVGTAAQMGELTGMVVHAHAGFTQRPYGEWEGHTWDEVRERWPEQYERRKRGLDPDIVGWGGSAQVGARVAQAVRDVTQEGQTVVAVSHGSAIALAVATLVGVDPTSRTFGHLPHTSWTVLEPVASGAWHIAAYGLGAD